MLDVREYLDSLHVPTILNRMGTYLCYKCTITYCFDTLNKAESIYAYLDWVVIVTRNVATPVKLMKKKTMNTLRQVNHQRKMFNKPQINAHTVLLFIAFSPVTFAIPMLWICCSYSMERHENPVGLQSPIREHRLILCRTRWKAAAESKRVLVRVTHYAAQGLGVGRQGIFMILMG